MSVTSGCTLLNVQRLDVLLVRLIFYAGTEWYGFRTLFSPHHLLYQVIKELHIARKKVMYIIKKRQTLQDEKFVQNRDPFGSTL
ncbi:hypothetical protein FNE59_08345 [Bacillus thuringiensis]|uniref:Uncharacterized protein n=1 Tax=Bacillus thuringiensis TaxID=1428 RepID=A0AAP4V3N6_BACTU|nr:hypothetical protein [Bacillus thuringiensis]MDN7079978.1 hypothetical protein [Bacillus thuringiensis]MDQ7258098.1 hypothetical protein [Bacillus thuringiensis]MDR5031636.1 hypothetical protein [Bacillus thuringiensis]MDR5045662.1 hypothetical protein [Bacillus thuringiensis]